MTTVLVLRPTSRGHQSFLSHWIHASFALGCITYEMTGSCNLSYELVLAYLIILSMADDPQSSSPVSRPLEETHLNDKPDQPDKTSQPLASSSLQTPDTTAVEFSDSSANRDLVTIAVKSSEDKSASEAWPSFGTLHLARSAVTSLTWPRPE